MSEKKNDFLSHFLPSLGGQYVFAFVVGAAISYVIAEKGAAVKRSGQRDAVTATISFTVAFGFVAIVIATTSISTHAAAALVAFVVGSVVTLFLYLTFSKTVDRHIKSTMDSWPLAGGAMEATSPELEAAAPATASNEECTFPDPLPSPIVVSRPSIPKEPERSPSPEPSPLPSIREEHVNDFGVSFM